MPAPSVSRASHNLTSSRNINVVKVVRSGLPGPSATHVLVDLITSSCICAYTVKKDLLLARFALHVLRRLVPLGCMFARIAAKSLTSAANVLRAFQTAQICLSTSVCTRVRSHTNVTNATVASSGMII
eukprot:g16270.t1